MPEYELNYFFAKLIWNYIFPAKYFFVWNSRKQCGSVIDKSWSICVKVLPSSWLGRRLVKFLRIPCIVKPKLAAWTEASCVSASVRPDAIGCVIYVELIKQHKKTLACASLCVQSGECIYLYDPLGNKQTRLHKFTNRSLLLVFASTAEANEYSVPVQPQESK
jgi:hypothetical protein